MITTQDDIPKEYEANQELEKEIIGSSMRSNSVLVLQPAREF